MSNMLHGSTFFCMAISLFGYEAGIFLRKKLKIGIFNPLLVSIAFVIIVLKVTGIDYDTYDKGANVLSYLLTPSTVCLAIPLYQQIELLKKNHKAVLFGILSGVLTSLTTIMVLAIIFKLSHKEYVTLLPKSITTAIGMGVSEELGGYVTITVAVIVITGVLGNILADGICKIFKSNKTILLTNRVSIRSSGRIDTVLILRLHFHLILSNAHRPSPCIGCIYISIHTLHVETDRQCRLGETSHKHYTFSSEKNGQSIYFHPTL